MVIHQNWTTIKVRNEENVKQITNAHISETRQDIKISSTYLESAANFTFKGLFTLYDFYVVYTYT